MFECEGFITKTGFAGDGENLLEVKALASIRQIERSVDFQIPRAQSHGRKICCGIEIAAVGLLHDHGQRLVILAGEFVEEHALCPIGFRQQIGCTQFIDDVR